MIIFDHYLTKGPDRGSLSSPSSARYLRIVPLSTDGGGGGGGGGGGEEGGGTLVSWTTRRWHDAAGRVVEVRTPVLSLTRTV